ncbi:hypothetical protein WOC09_23925, partial [Vibrio parahaemolyticus]
MAFLVCVKFSGYGALQRLMYCVPAPLNAALYAGGGYMPNIYEMVSEAMSYAESHALKASSILNE